MKTSTDERPSNLVLGQTAQSQTSVGDSRRHITIAPSDERKPRHRRNSSKRPLDVTRSDPLPSRTYHVSLGSSSEQSQSKPTHGLRKDWSMKTVYSQEDVDPDVAAFVMHARNASDCCDKPQTEEQSESPGPTESPKSRTRNSSSSERLANKLKSALFRAKQ